MLVTMRRLLASGWLACALLACDSGDGEVEGAHGDCTFGGTLTDCPDVELTSEGACWRLVDCGAIPLEVEEEGRFDWGRCVDELDQLIESRQRLVIECIAASTCDELRVSEHCGRFGN